MGTFALYKLTNIFPQISTITLRDCLPRLLDLHPKWLLAVPKYQRSNGMTYSTCWEVTKECAVSSKGSSTKTIPNMSEESQGLWNVQLLQMTTWKRVAFVFLSWPVLKLPAPFHRRQSSHGGFGVLTSYLLIQRGTIPKLSRYCLFHAGFRDLSRQLCASSFLSQSFV